jgi:hypothetical protein
MEIEERARSEAFATKLLQPGHAFRSSECLELFPKKLRFPFAYRLGAQKTVLWGINVVEGVNTAAVVWLALLIMISSAVLGLVYSLVTHDVSAAFTLAACFLTSLSLVITHLQFRRCYSTV